MINNHIIRRILFSLIATWLVAGALVTAQRQEQQAVRASLNLISSGNLEIQQSLDQLQLRHSRITRRVREALSLESSFERDSVLAWAVDGYARAMEAGNADVSMALQSAQAKSDSEQLTLDLDRFSLQLDRLQGLAGSVETTLSDLIPTQQNELLRSWPQATAAFHRSDSGWTTAFTTAKATLTRAMAREQSRLSNPNSGTFPHWGWLGLLLPLILLWTLSPLRRIVQLSLTGQPVPVPLTETEARLGRLLSVLRQESERLQSQNTEFSAELARLSVTSRRQERDAALLRIYTDNLVDNLRSGIVVTDPAGTVTSYNLTARKLLEFEESAQGTPIHNTALYAALEKSTTSASQTLTSILENGKLARFEGITLSSGDREALLDLRVVPYLDESGSPRGLLWVADDITESVQMKNQLIATEHMATVGRISAQVAHEIRNPLSSIGLNAELLDEEFSLGLEDPARTEARQLLSAIANEIERLNEITEGYLQLARMPRPKIQECDLNTLITDFMAMSRPEFKNNNVAVELSLSSTPPMTRADPGQIRQALLNVVRNSMEAMNTGGTIRVVSELQGSTCVIHLLDDGPGIPENLRHRIFEPFYSTKQAGTGLGLSLTQQILADHGGTISVDENKPSGARITLNLPSLTDQPKEQKST
ncbi:MAG: PAS domain-containing protein [Deltaproteobacteria bacterium]|jgi:signal transduction histidine kinase|nr:PAS domain-containing protein [Deltaproteobacteria bacterium]MBT6433613.1 PAS domain-containing protein [Deltaproteobacteria bacterium]